MSMENVCEALKQMVYVGRLEKSQNATLLQNGVLRNLSNLMGIRNT